jgi:hypothetical protein
MTGQRGGGRRDAAAKPTVESLRIDPAAQHWRRSGTGAGSIEVALVSGADGTGTEWVLMRVCDDPQGRVLVYDAYEWECFLDGVRKGEFDEDGGGQSPQAGC